MRVCAVLVPESKSDAMLIYFLIRSLPDAATVRQPRGRSAQARAANPPGCAERSRDIPHRGAHQSPVFSHCQQALGKAAVAAHRVGRCRRCVSARSRLQPRRAYGTQYAGSVIANRAPSETRLGGRAPPQLEAERLQCLDPIGVCFLGRRTYSSRRAAARGARYRVRPGRGTTLAAPSSVCAATLHGSRSARQRSAARRASTSSATAAKS